MVCGAVVGQVHKVPLRTADKQHQPPFYLYPLLFLISLLLLLILLLFVIFNINIVIMFDIRLREA